MLAQEFLGEHHHLNAGDAEAFLLKSGEYSAHELALHCRWFKDDESFLYHE